MHYPSVSGAGLVLAFPDVCKTPSPGGGVPIPYPATATKARQARSAKKGTRPATGTMSAMGRKVSEPGPSLASFSARGRTSFTKAGAPDVIAEGEAAVLRSRLGALGNQLKSMNSADPADWQSLLEEYLVVAGALFVTLHG